MIIVTFTCSLDIKSIKKILRKFKSFFRESQNLKRYKKCTLMLHVVVEENNSLLLENILLNGIINGGTLRSQSGSGLNNGSFLRNPH